MPLYFDAFLYDQDELAQKMRELSRAVATHAELAIIDETTKVEAEQKAKAKLEKEKEDELQWQRTTAAKLREKGYKVFAEMEPAQAGSSGYYYYYDYDYYYYYYYY
jgi:hypothetical protein